MIASYVLTEILTCNRGMLFPVQTLQLILITVKFYSGLNGHEGLIERNYLLLLSILCHFLELIR